MNYDAGRSEPNICLQDHTNCTIHSCISNTEIKCTTLIW